MTQQDNFARGRSAIGSSTDTGALAQAQARAATNRRAAANAAMLAERQRDAGRDLIRRAANPREAVDRIDAVREADLRAQRLRQAEQIAAQEEMMLQEARQNAVALANRSASQQSPVPAVPPELDFGPDFGFGTGAGARLQAAREARAAEQTARRQIASGQTTEVSSTTTASAPAAVAPVSTFGFGIGGGDRLQAAREAREREERLMRMIPPSQRGIGVTDLAGEMNAQRPQAQATQTPVPLPPSRRISGETDLAAEATLERQERERVAAERARIQAALQRSANDPASTDAAGQATAQQQSTSRSLRNLTDQDLIDFVLAQRAAQEQRFINQVLPEDPLNDVGRIIGEGLDLQPVTYALTNPVIDREGNRLLPIDQDIVTIDGLQVPLGHPFSNNRGIAIGTVPTVPDGASPGLFYHEVLHAIEQQRIPLVWEVGWGITKLMELEIPLPFDVPLSIDLPLPGALNAARTVLDLFGIEKPNDRFFEGRADDVQDFVNDAVRNNVNLEGFRVVAVPR